MAVTKVVQWRIAIGLLLLPGVLSINWLGMPHNWESSAWNWTNAIRAGKAVNSTCWSAVKQKLFTSEQAKVCIRHPGAMLSVWEAAFAASQACRDAFAERRWNCSSVGHLPKKTPDLTRGTREQAWLYALASASLAKTIARGCSSGNFKQCACGSFPRHPPDGQFKWGGCGDDIKYGKQFAKMFTDSPLKKAGRKAANALLRAAEQADFTGRIESPTEHWKQPHIMSAINLHNNRVGRKVIEQSLQTQCKCHGVSGSCQVKTCWRSLPSIGEIAQRMKRLYGLAVEVVPRRPNDMRRRSAVSSGRLTALMAVQHHGVPSQPSMIASSAGRDGGFTEHDLIYITKSPDYCLPDKHSGSLGTAGRTCNASQNANSGSCSSLCCGRGYVTTIQERLERCNCKYIWCCTVQCKTCRRHVQVNTCK